jgi:hypothetical protein
MDRKRSIKKYPPQQPESEIQEKQLTPTDAEGEKKLAE